MDRKIILIGQDRIRRTRISTILERCELAGFEYTLFPSFTKAKNELTECDPCLVLMHGKKKDDILGFSLHMQENPISR